MNHDTALSPQPAATAIASIDGAGPPAVKDQMTYRGFHAELLMTECDDRARRHTERRIKAPGFPRETSLQTFDFHPSPNSDPTTLHTLPPASGSRKGQPHCLIGDSGTGTGRR